MSMSTYVHPEPPVQAQIVALGIRDTNYFLSCHMEGKVPTLRVEVKPRLSDGCVISSEKNESYTSKLADWLQIAVFPP